MFTNTYKYLLTPVNFKSPRISKTKRTKKRTHGNINRSRFIVTRIIFHVPMLCHNGDCFICIYEIFRE